MSEHVRTTRETVELLLRTVTEGTRDDLADLYAEDVVVTNPFVPQEVRGSRGNAALRARMKTFAQHLHYSEVKNVTIHETTDPTGCGPPSSSRRSRPRQAPRADGAAAAEQRFARGPPLSLAPAPTTGPSPRP